MDNWNKIFTNLIRTQRNTYWGNWTLMPTVGIGAIGILDENTVNFTYLGTLERYNPIHTQNNVAWKMTSEKVSQNQANVALDGAFIDPETGEAVNAGIEASWAFGNEESIASNFSVTKQSTLDDAAKTIKDQWQQIAALAQANGMGDGTNISQGFCVVTTVTYASCGMNVGSMSKNSKFSITGTAEGIAGMLGGGGEGSWFYTENSSGFNSILWPAEAGKLAETDVPIAFMVASFDQTNLIPVWTTRLNFLQLRVSNKNGGTYIVDCDLTYNIPDVTQQQSKSQDVSGGRAYTFELPLNATNLKLSLRFKRAIESKEKTFHLSWNNPLMEWMPSGSGRHTVELYGVWPADPSIGAGE
ncbi:hypothetical protein [Candidatus Electronema sp. PJ]|uniref:hypothetical protein n=1 Tax=Candidatus Electronema sp. PJ TaxID=3401572 RepID=UPI003AA9E1B2